MPNLERGRVVKYRVYAHSNKESVYEAALDAGFTPDELSEKFADLTYVGYEISIDVTVDRETGKITEALS